MQKIETTLINKTQTEAQEIKALFDLLIAHLSTQELLRIKKKLQQNPKLLKSALKFV